MTRNILEAVNKAREIFEIKGFPSDFFHELNKSTIPINTRKGIQYMDNNDQSKSVGLE